MTAKLHAPTVQPWAVMRERLFERVSLGVAGPLTLVTAPAGSGKTMLLSSWLATNRSPGPAAWLSLDEQDDEPGTLWSYVLAALDNAGIPTGRVGTPDRSDGVDHSLLIRLAACLSEQPQPVVLILDNAQFLTGAAVPDGIDFLLRHAGPQLRVVLIGRLDPALPLHRYRVAGSMVEVRLDELAFTLPEIRTLLGTHDTRLSEQSLVALARRTKGWAASLRMAALALQHRSGTGDPAEFASDQSDIADYFVAEVLDAQPPGIRNFLLRTSVVDRMWPGLAIELSGHRDAPRTLATLAHTNTFVAPDPTDGHSYEYHPIVRELLRARLRQETPHKVGQLHRKAAQWLVEAGQVTDAVAHAAAAGDWEQAAILFVADLAIGRMITGPQSPPLAATFSAMPPDVPGPEAAVVQAALALVKSDPDACAKHLLRAHELVADRPSEQTADLQLSATVAEVVRARIRGELDAVLSAAATAETALTGMAANDLHALVLLNKGGALLRAGDVDAAVATLTDALAAAEAPGCEHLRLGCLGELALIEAQRGQLRRATEFGRRAVIATERCEPPDQSPPAADIALAWVYAEEYDLSAARTHADRAASTAEIRCDPVAATVLALVRARLQRARGDVAGAAAAMARIRAGSPAGQLPPWLLDRLSTAEASVRTAGGSPAGDVIATSDPTGSSPGTMVLALLRHAAGATTEANQLVARVLTQPDLPLDVLVDAWLLAATCELTRGRPDLARTALDRALRLAAPEKLRRPVIEAPPRLRRFLRQERDLTERHGWLGTAVVGPPEARRDASADGPDGFGPRLIVEALTEKEAEVLRYLAALLSTEEIARTMFVSVNTVKTHVRGVLRKLSASRRNEAIRRARDLGLI